MLGITNNGTCNQTTGQCECKQNVTGRQCDGCEDTFWGFRLPPIGDCRGKCLWTEVVCIIAIIIITCDIACSLMGDLVLLVKLLHRMVQKLITSPYKNYLNSCNHCLHK